MTEPVKCRHKHSNYVERHHGGGCYRVKCLVIGEFNEILPGKCWIGPMRETYTDAVKAWNKLMEVK